MSIAAKHSRLPYIDNIRIFCTVLVVLQHAAVTYSGMGSWYYTERTALDLPSMLIFGVFQSHTQAFFMALFFLLAGYFIPASLERKGPCDFLADRLLRLGAPLLLYVFALHPRIVKILHPEMNFGVYYLKGLRSLGFISWTGPLWFVEALLIFTIACLPFAQWLKPSAEIPAGPLPAGKMWLLVALITEGAFAIRLVYPVGTSVANLQFCYFAAYVVAFVVGVLAGKHNWFEQISYGSAKHWLIASFSLGLPLWLGSTVAGGAMNGRTDFNGGLHLAALGYAFWESFFCVAIIIAILGIAREKVNFQKPWMRFLSHNSFGVYVFHAVVLVLASLALRSLALAACSIRQIPLLRRLFS